MYHIMNNTQSNQLTGFLSTDARRDPLAKFEGSMDIGQKSMQHKLRQALNRAASGKDRTLALSKCGFTTFPEELLDIDRVVSGQKKADNSRNAYGERTFSSIAASRHAVDSGVDLSFDRPSAGRNSIPTSSPAAPHAGRLKANPNFFTQGPAEEVDLRWWEIGEIKRLDLSENRLEEFPSDLATTSMSQVDTLFVQSNRLREVPQSSTFKNVNCSSNRISHVVVGENVVELRASDNCAVGIAPAMQSSTASKLMLLDLERNKIKSFPSERFPQLLKLNVKENFIEQLDLSSTPKIAELIVEKNKLRHLDLRPVSKSLVFLNAGTNHLENLVFGTDTMLDRGGSLGGSSMLDQRFGADSRCGADPTKTRASIDPNTPGGGDYQPIGLRSALLNSLSSDKRSMCKVSAELSSEQRLKDRPIIDRYYSVVNKQSPGKLSGGFNNVPTAEPSRLDSRKPAAFQQVYETPKPTISYPNLDTIIIPHNRLTSPSVSPGLTPELLPRLSVLVASNNRLEKLPSSLANIRTLQTLDIQNNDLTDIPSELGLCQALKRVALEGNAIKVIRPHILRGSVEELKKYLRGRLDVTALQNAKDSFAAQNPGLNAANNLEDVKTLKAELSHTTPDQDFLSRKRAQGLASISMTKNNIFGGGNEQNSIQHRGLATFPAKSPGGSSPPFGVDKYGNQGDRQIRQSMAQNELGINERSRPSGLRDEPGTSNGLGKELGMTVPKNGSVAMHNRSTNFTEEISPKNILAHQSHRISQQNANGTNSAGMYPGQNDFDSGHRASIRTHFPQHNVVETLIGKSRQQLVVVQAIADDGLRNIDAKYAHIILPTAAATFKNISRAKFEHSKFEDMTHFRSMYDEELTDLEMTHCMLDFSLPSSLRDGRPILTLGPLNNLRTIDLARNDLIEMPDTSRCRNLYELKLHYNQIVTLHPVFIPPSLRILDVSINKIEVIVQPEIFIDPQRVQINTLLLQNNSLREFPVCWGRWEMLKTLTLQGNMLRRYPDVHFKGLDFFKNYLQQKEGVSL